jgi:hypothetical protein
MGRVIAFKPQSGPWTPWERSILGEIQRTFAQQGLMTDCEHGLSDSNTPWTAFYTVNRGSFVAHVARHERGYVLLWPDRTSIRMQEMERLVETVRSSATQHAWVMSGTD